MSKFKIDLGLVKQAEDKQRELKSTKEKEEGAKTSRRSSQEDKWKEARGKALNQHREMGEEGNPLPEKGGIIEAIITENDLEDITAMMSSSGKLRISQEQGMQIDGNEEGGNEENKVENPQASQVSSVSPFKHK